ncbi:protease modulator HflC [Candidatus Sneabacter namystus]|uniref:Protein HflC n=1 Tax=Candidatus Sneabacter namystus TaxID=2601646 RepID=A0A5C0UI52_9RICK|nr:protease modulator HflC [Candidatus Sneabacter namystus]QEK39430.1 protease modulator HflC [Candidatus Sneabacter namystus]
MYKFPQKKALTILPLSFFFALIALFNSVTIVDERQTAVIFEFGRVVREVTNPGITLKIPVLQSVVFYDKRIVGIPVEAQELTASDSKRVIVDAIAYLKIISPKTFYKSVNSVQNSKIRVKSRLESSLRKVIGKNPLISLLSSQRSQMMLEISSILSEELKDLGMEVIDVRISRADLPQENSVAICRRMQTSREQEARKIRAEGSAEAARIIADADKETRVCIAQAKMQNNLIKGEGEAKASEIYNNAYSQDPDFFRFYKAMNTYKRSFSRDTKFFVSTKSDFMKFSKLGD